MHSSRMRTVRCSGRLDGGWGGGFGQGGVCQGVCVCLSRGGCLSMGVSVWGCVCLSGGCLSGRCLSSGGLCLSRVQGGVCPGGVVCVCLAGGVCPPGGSVYPSMQWGRHSHCGQTYTCKNITFPQLLLRTVMNGRPNIIVRH